MVCGLKVMKRPRCVEATSMHTKASVVGGIKPCCYQKNENRAKNQQPWTAVSALFGPRQDAITSKQVLGSQVAVKAKNMRT